MGELNEKMDGLLNELKAGRGKRHAIEGHPLAERNDYIRNKYLQILCAVLLYRNNTDEVQQLLLERIITGAKAEHGAEEYLRMALDVSSQTLNEMVDGFKKDPPLKYVFAMDALLICHVKKCEDGQAAFIAELFDTLGITELELKYILGVAKAVLSLDQRALMKAEDLRPNYMDRAVFVHYVWLMGKNAVIDLIHTTPEELKEIAKGIDGDAIILYITLDAQNKMGFNNTFAYGKNLMFRNCDFTCNTPLQFGRYTRVTFEDCTFSGFKTEALILNNVTEAVFLRCQFTDCIKEHKDRTDDWKELGGVIKCLNATRTTLDIDACNFTNCGGHNSNYYRRSSIISDGQVRECINSVFRNCWHYIYGTTRDPLHEKRLLFSHVTHEENNKVINSARICPGGYEDDPDLKK